MNKEYVVPVAIETVSMCTHLSCTIIPPRQVQLSSKMNLSMIQAIRRTLPHARAAACRW